MKRIMEVIAMNQVLIVIMKVNIIEPVVLIIIITMQLTVTRKVIWILNLQNIFTQGLEGEPLPGNINSVNL